MKNKIKTAFFLTLFTIIGINYSRLENKLELFPQWLDYQQNKNTQENPRGALISKTGGTGSADTLLKLIGKDCKFIRSLYYYSTVGLKQELFYCKSKKHYLSTLTQNGKEHPLFFLFPYNVKTNESKFNYIDKEQNGINGNEELYWRK